MPAFAIDPKLQAYGDRLTDNSVSLSEFEVRGIMRDLDSMSGRDHALDARLYGLRALCYIRLSRPDKAVEQFRLGLQRVREPDPLRKDFLCNQAAAYLALGRPKEAALSAIEAARIPPPHPVTLANLAEALAQLGERDTALEVFGEAVDVSDFTDAARTFDMATTAAAIGLDSSAVEFFARFVVLREGQERADRRAIDVVRSAGPVSRAAYSQQPALRGALRRALAFDDESARQRTLEPVPDDELAHQEAADVFEATMDLRAGAAALRLRDRDETR